MARNTWTVEREEALKAFYARGFSAARIAVALGMKNGRNSVGGKIRRMKLTREGTIKEPDTGAAARRRAMSAVKSAETRRANLGRA